MGYRNCIDCNDRVGKGIALTCGQTVKGFEEDKEWIKCYVTVGSLSVDPAPGGGTKRYASWTACDGSEAQLQQTTRLSGVSQEPSFQGENRRTRNVFRDLTPAPTRRRRVTPAPT